MGTEEKGGEAGADEKLMKAREELNEEELTTAAERLDWLRSRGIQVEGPNIPEPKALPGGGQRFKYVYLPVDETKPAEELVGEAAGPGDVLPALVGTVFAGRIDDETLLNLAKAHGEAVGLDALRQSVSRGGADSFRLAAPSPENGREAVNAYVDDCSTLKGLPRNVRATALARACGFPDSCVFHGDVFLGRVLWPESGVKNGDFHLKDLEPAALWQKRAPTENLRFQQQTQPEEHADAQRSSQAPADNVSGSGEGYTWQDSQEDVEITVLSPSVNKKDVKVMFKRRSVEVKAPVQMSLELYAAVDNDSCSWVLCKEGIRLTLPKDQETSWPQLLK